MKTSQEQEELCGSGEDPGPWLHACPGSGTGLAASQRAWKLKQP